MALVDVVRLDVRAYRAPQVYAPATVTIYEGRSVDISVSVVVGYPNAHDFLHALQDDERDAVAEGGSNPDISYTEWDWQTWPADSGGVQTVTIQAPTLPGNSPLYVDWYVIFTLVSSHGIASSTTRIRVYQNVASTISFPENVSAYEGTVFSSNALMYNAGSPLATTIRHSFHNSIADARADRNPVSSGRPSVVITPTDTQLAALSSSPISERTGSLRYGSALPAVSADTRWYGRLEIVQNGSVVDYAAYTLLIQNAVQPSISVTNIQGMEGQQVSTPFTYNAGAPYATQFVHVGFYSSLSDAQSNRNRLTSSDGIPSSISFTPSAPAARAGNQSGTLRMTLPYVTADKRIWGLVRIQRRNAADNGWDFWQGIYRVDISNRVVATIDVQEVITMNEESTMMIMFNYTNGNPKATGHGVSIHESEADANANRNPVMASDDPRITLSAHDASGDGTTQKTGTATIVTPDIGNNNRTWWPRFYMQQEAITPDP